MRKELFFKAQKIDEEKYTIEGVFSTGAEDRHGEIIDQNGWNIKEYMQNPVILFGHDQWTPAIGKTLELNKDGNGNLAGKIQFAVEEYELAKTIFNLYKGGFMRAFSVGFMNNKYEVDEENDVLILKENTLYEISCVNVPANAMALAATKGIDVTPLKKIESEIEKIEKRLVNTIQNAINLIRDDSADKEKVETPLGKGIQKHYTRQINKAIRNLIKQKRQ